MKGLKRFFTLLAVSAAFALFTGNLTILADNPAGGTDGDSISGSVQTEPEGTGTSPGTSTETSQTDGNGNTSPNPSVTEMFVCNQNGIITGVNPEYLQSLGTQELKISLTIHLKELLTVYSLNHLLIITTRISSKLQITTSLSV